MTRLDLGGLREQGSPCRQAAAHSLHRLTWHGKGRGFLVRVDRHFGCEGVKLILADDVQLLEVLHILLRTANTQSAQQIVACRADENEAKLKMTTSGSPTLFLEGHHPACSAANAAHLDQVC